MRAQPRHSDLQQQPLENVFRPFRHQSHRVVGQVFDTPRHAQPVREAARRVAKSHALNIPLDQLQSRFAELDRNRPVVVCCASGARSSMARSLLVRAGFSEVHNAGPWRALQG